MLSHVFQCFTGIYEYCRIARLKNIFNFYIGIFNFGMAYSKKIRRKEVYTFVVTNYWHHKNIQNSSTSFVSVLHFADKFTDTTILGESFAI